ncbi:MAG: hypothetical protein GY928_30595 [Colwellia sp.]|nr:hypothetical protein [Colwellia sp.]
MKILKGLALMVGGSMFVIAIFLLAPLILLSSINTLAEQAQVSFYIPHTFWSYVASYGLMICLGRGSSSKEK